MSLSVSISSWISSYTCIHNNKVKRYTSCVLHSWQTGWCPATSSERLIVAKCSIYIYLYRFSHMSVRLTNCISHTLWYTRASLVMGETHEREPASAHLLNIPSRMPPSREAQPQQRALRLVTPAKKNNIYKYNAYRSNKTAIICCFYARFSILFITLCTLSSFITLFARFINRAWGSESFLSYVRAYSQNNFATWQWQDYGSINYNSAAIRCVGIRDDRWAARSINLITVA